MAGNKKYFSRGMVSLLEDLESDDVAAPDPRKTGTASWILHRRIDETRRS
jgi:hypothetical protein